MNDRSTSKLPSLVKKAKLDLKAQALPPAVVVVAAEVAFAAVEEASVEDVVDSAEVEVAGGLPRKEVVLLRTSLKEKMTAIDPVASDEAAEEAAAVLEEAEEDLAPTRTGDCFVLFCFCLRSIIHIVIATF
jgi:hypothetical protein